MPQIEIDEDLLDLQRRSKSDVYKSKLVNRLIDMVHIAKKLFGPRDLCYTIVDIEFVSDDPYIGYPYKDHHIIIQLSDRAAKNMSQACYEMAHETVHLLAPTGGSHATNLEEGVACYFAAYYMKRKRNEPTWRPNLPSYKCVLEAVMPLLDEDICCVRKLRERQPSFQAMSKGDISKEFPDLTPDKVCFLKSTFKRDSGC
jgi:hypothetical protein